MTTFRRSAVSVLLLTLLLALAGPAQARPGGGHSYSGSHSSHSSGSHSSPSHSSGSHSSSGSGYHSTPSVSRPSLGPVVPVVPIRPSQPSRPSSPGSTGLGCGCMLIMLLVFIGLIVLIIWMIKRSKAAAPPPGAPPPQPLDLDVIRTLDPDFSAVLFLDFAYALYARAHQARANSQALDALSPYLSPAVRAALAAREPAGVPVAEVVVGALRVVGIHLPSPPSQATQPAQVRVRLEIESNLTLGDAGSERTQYAAESWTLVRDAGVRTKPPQDVQSFHCPNCGAPFASSGSDRCEYCGEVVSNGRFDWTVVAADLDGVEDAPPALTGTVEEEGTNLPTIFHPQALARRAELLKDDPATTDQALAARLQLIYNELNTAWTNLDLRPIRPYVSDSLFDYLQYWIDAYNRQGLRNVLQGMRLTGLEMVKVVRDRWFDAVTFRIRATGRDTTVRQATGELVGGRPDRDRQYSEYWTLIRGAGVKGAPRADKSCPNCGAALEAADVNQAGQCAHCGARITRGDFDWVLSRIEQDESYTG
ncbi:MAG TPA: TIM44-like domain-containing protein [Thermoanaerobaculia bacterium]|nr:TIM44-like domain-containing protein [Thermoanaerobaculia bacterium]